MELKKFKLYWPDGTSEFVEGQDIANAFRRAGYGGGAIGAFALFACSHKIDRVWNPATGTWEKDVHTLEGKAG